VEVEVELKAPELLKDAGIFTPSCQKKYRTTPVECTEYREEEEEEI
jgi:hypothetical protein